MADGTGPLLPELARSLRSLGAHRDPCSALSHDAVFGPLLDARARAGTDSKEKALAALKGSAVMARIRSAATAAATRDIKDPPLARARSAHAQEALAALGSAFDELDRLAIAARDSEREWNLWVDQLRTVFMRADVACESLAKLLEIREEKPRAGEWLRWNRP